MSVIYDPIPHVNLPIDIRDGINHLRTFFRLALIARLMGQRQHWLSVHLAFGENVARSHPFRFEDTISLKNGCECLAKIILSLPQLEPTDKETMAATMEQITKFVNPRFLYKDVLRIDQRLWHKCFSTDYSSPCYNLSAEQCAIINHTMMRLAVHLVQLSFVCNDDELKKKTL